MIFIHYHLYVISDNIGSTIYQAMFDLKHKAGCSPSYSSGYTAHEVKAYSEKEETWKLNNQGRVIDG